MQGAWHSRLSRISLQSTFSAWLSHFQLSLSYHHPVYWFMCVYLLACTNTNPAYWLPPAQNLLHSPNHKSFLPPLNIHSKYSVSLWYRWSCFTMLIIFNLQPNIFPVFYTYLSYSFLNTSTQVSYGHLIFLSSIKLVIFSPKVCFPPVTPILINGTTTHPVSRQRSFLLLLPHRPFNLNSLKLRASSDSALHPQMPRIVRQTR